MLNFILIIDNIDNIETDLVDVYVLNKAKAISR